MNERPCKGCGPTIYIAGKGDGFIPLERVANVYTIFEVSINGKPTGNYMAEEIGPAVDNVPLYISHFLTCPKANEFSGSKKS